MGIRKKCYICMCFLLYLIATIVSETFYNHKFDEYYLGNFKKH